MRLELFLCVLICLCFGCKTSKLTKASSETSEVYTFPQDWIGDYHGNLNLLAPAKDTIMVVDMKLSIGYPDAVGLYPWVLTYADEDIRSYGLEVLDVEKGHYLIDEYNSIKLDAFLRGNHFISRFEVMGSDLIFHYEKLKGGIDIKVYSSKASPYSISGEEIIGSDTIPPVESFLINGYQEGYLKEIK